MTINYGIIHDIEKNYIHRKMPGKLIAYLFDHYSEDIYGFYENKSSLYEDILTDVGKYECGLLKPTVRSPLRRIRDQYEELKRYNSAVLDDYRSMETEYNKMTRFLRDHKLFKLYHEDNDAICRDKILQEGKIEELPFL